MAMKFRAHDTFFIRKGWLSKGMKYVQKKPDVFVAKDENPMDVLGIGANMVKALRYWLQAVGLTEEPSSGKRVQTFTSLGNSVFTNDRYIEELGTLYLLHYRLSSNKDEATAWYFFFNEFNMTEFSRDDFVEFLQRRIRMEEGEVSVAIRSLNDDFSCIINTYLPRYKSNPNRIAPESNIDCPFGELGLIDTLSKEKKTYRKVIPLANTIASWVGENYHGIFDMATGTGKTFTGLGAISKLSEDLNDKLAVVIVCPYQHLVEQWVEDIVRFNMKPIIGYSSSPQKDWKQRLSKAVRDQKIRVDKSFFCFVCTNATFTNSYVQEQISKIHSPVLLVVDEAHNFGAASYARLLDDRFTYRLALSATLERHRDEEGTALLYAFFGKKCIEYSLDRAIEEDKLTPYKYYPVVVHLNDDELTAYEQLSYEMSKCVIKGKNGKYKLNKHGEILALKRARIVAGASEKLDALREEIRPYIHDNNILVYCGATNVLDENADYTSSDTGDIRQIEAVTRILGNEFGMDVAQFTSRENMETRAAIKEKFQRGDRLQAIVAIKCLDEGVNIPGIRTAFILASTTNPKEYIQRRGRVLRKAPNKPYAVIYDFVTLPRPLDSVSSLTTEQAQRDLTLVKNELARIKEFGRLSQNSMDANNLIWDIQEAYHITDEESEEGGFEYGTD